MRSPPTSRAKSSLKRSFDGTVEYFYDESGSGAIKADSGELITVKRDAITGRQIKTLCPNERVRAVAVLVTQAWRAQQVAVLWPEGGGLQEDQSANLQEAVVTFAHPGHQYYLLANQQHPKIYLNRVKILDALPAPLVEGATVRCVVVPTTRGCSAIIVPQPGVPPVVQASPLRSQDYLVSQALLWRDRKDFEAAKRFFEEARRTQPSHDLYFAYAAMEKNLGRFGDAVAILDEAVERYPGEGKFYEDLGNLLLRIPEAEKAAEVFRRGLDADPAHAILHRFYAKALLQIGDEPNLKKARDQFEIAAQKRILSKEDELQLNHIKVRLGPRRGRLMLDFMRDCKMEVRTIQFAEQETYAVDLLVHPMTPEYRESYDLTEHLYVRCFYKRQVTAEDINLIARAQPALLQMPGVNPEVCFVLLESWDELKEYLYRLADEKSGRTIVPLADMDLAEGTDSLRKTLDLWLFRRDLYDVRVPVTGKKFFGRERELVALDRSIDDGEWVGLFGLRKIGKTSTIEEIGRRRSNDIVVVLDLQKLGALPSPDWLLWHIVGGAAQRLRDVFPEAWEVHRSPLFRNALATGREPPKDIWTRFDNEMMPLLEGSKFQGAPDRLVIVFDEIERILPVGTGSALPRCAEFFGYLRALTQRTGALSVIVVGANPWLFEQARWEGRDNPVFQFARELYMPPLTREDCSVMISSLGRGTGVSYTEDALDRIYAATGGHPYFSRQLCSFIVKESSRPLHVDGATVTRHLQPFVFERSPLFKEVLERLQEDFPAEWDLLLFIAAEVCSDEKGLRSLAGPDWLDALRHLLGYQLVDRDTGGKFTVRIGLLKMWLADNVLSS